MPYLIPPEFNIGTAEARVEVHAIAWAVIDPSKAGGGEYTYIDGLRHGIRCFHSGETNNPLTIARSNLGDDVIGDNLWVSNGKYFVTIANPQIIHAIGANRPMRIIQSTFTGNANATTGLLGQLMFEYVTRAGVQLLRPTTNTNSALHIMVCKVAQA